MEDRGPQLAAVTIAFLVTSWLLVSLRGFIRGWMIRSFGIDDWLMVLTLVILPTSFHSIQHDFSQRLLA